MIFKVIYQPTKTEAPRRESSLTLYIEADSAVTARKLIEQHTEYNIEFIHELNGAHLAYEQQNPQFSLREF